MDKVKLSSIRQQFPMYGDLPDEQLLIGLRKKFYADIPMKDFVNRIDFDTQREQFSPTSGMSGFEKFVAGYGKAGADLVRGTGQRLGLVSQDDIDEMKRLDAPLMESGAGSAGNVLGNVAAFLPTAFVPGANTVTGAAATGAIMGALAPTASDESVLGNIALGGAAGGGGVIAGRALNAAWQGGKALVAPFTQSGRTKIAGRTLSRFADDASSIQRAGRAPTLTGANPTLAERTGDAGLARLQDAIRSVDPQIENRIGRRLAENNAARVNTLRQLAGQDGERAFNEASRNAAAQDLYAKAFSVKPDPMAFSAAQKGEITKLRQMPAVQEAMAEAQRIARNQGKNIKNPAGSIEGLHLMKLALDDKIASAKTGALGSNQAKAIETARDRLVTLIERLSPDYAEARATYAAMSRPINQMDIAQEVFNRATSNTSNLAGDPRMQANALMGMLKNEGALIERATGRKLGGSLADVLEPDQLARLRAVASETDRAAAVASAGAGPGSPTAQRLASQNILRQVIGPTGLPQSWAESALANTLVGKPLNLLYGGVADPLIQRQLADALLDPAIAQRALQSIAAPQVQRGPLEQLLMRSAGQAARTLPPALAIER